MKIEETFEQLSFYYNVFSRKCGYTTMLRRMLSENDEPLVFVGSIMTGKNVLRVSKKRLVTPTIIHRLIGRNEPLFIDNNELGQLFSAGFNRIEELKKENTKLRKKLSESRQRN